MTQLIEPSGLNPRQVATPNSRYLRNQNVIYYGEQRFLTYDLYVRVPYKRTGNEKVMVITKGVEYRPDLVSFDFYGFPENWWKILEANKMSDIFDFKTGKTILLPDITGG
jgi:hypothetical protein